MNDPFRLQRFVDAQALVYDTVRTELEAGCKRSHWMWFVFPQVQGLGSSATSRRFAIASLDEARAYRAHPVLGPRLTECTRLVNAIEGKSASQIFGTPDDFKFRSSMTLFAQASAHPEVFDAALRKYYGGEPDERTLELLGA